MNVWRPVELALTYGAATRCPPAGRRSRPTRRFSRQTVQLLPRGIGVEGWWENAPSADGHDVRWVLFDARGDRVYAACYRSRPGGAMETVVPPLATSIGQLLEERAAPGAAYVGDGAWGSSAWGPGATVPRTRGGCA